MATQSITVTINGEAKSAEVEDRLLLVHLIRDNYTLTGTHIGCDTSQCGACVVHLNGSSVKSCTTLAADCDGTEIKTIEGIANNGKMHTMQEAFK